MENSPLDNNFGNIQGNQALPNATAVLVLGILSIVLCICYGIIGLILGIIALSLAGKDLQLYNANPQVYKQSSYNNLKAGRVCAIIGTVLSGLYILVVVFALIAGSSMSGLSRTFP